MRARRSATLWLVATMGWLGAMSVLSACGGDDEPPKPPPQEQKKEKTNN